MFRDVIYITYDYTVRVQDGYLIFRWWRSYVPKDVSEGKLNRCFKYKQSAETVILIFQICRIQIRDFP